MVSTKRHSAWLATSLMLAAVTVAAGETQPVRGRQDVDTTSKATVSKTMSRHLTADSSIGNLLGHPAFSGYGNLLMPWSDRAYDPKMRLSDFGSLLPYHSAVDPGSVVAGLNRMIADVNRGDRVFYDIYTDDEKRADPSKEQTGLFFFRGRPGAPFAIVSPGGGFSYVGSAHEGFPYAAEISTDGYNAFVLKYRIGQGGAAATVDLAAALSWVFRNAGDLRVGTANFSLWGSSAGARMAAAIGSHGAAAFGGDRVAKPAALVMAYTAHSDLSSDEPPTFVVVGERDGIAPPSVMERRIERLRRAGTEVEYHRFPNVGHGFGPGVGTSAEGWIGNAIGFWKKVAANKPD